MHPAVFLFLPHFALGQLFYNARQPAWIMSPLQSSILKKETTDNQHDTPVCLAITDAWQAICATGRLSPGHPGFCKMAILQANPITLRSGQSHQGLCNRPLPLSQTDHVQTLSRLHALLLSKSLHTSYSVGRLTTHARCSDKLMTQPDWCRPLGTVSSKHKNCMHMPSEQQELHA